MVRTPVNTHAASSQPGELIIRAMSAETMKIPEPIIAPITIMVASYSPMPRTKVLVSLGVVAFIGSVERSIVAYSGS